MKIKLKDIGKGLAALGTLVGGVILAAQTKKGMSEQVYEPTLEPLGDEPIEVEAEETEQEEETEEEDKDEDE